MYEINLIKIDSGFNQIITKDINYFNLLEIRNNEVYYHIKYSIKVRTVPVMNYSYTAFFFSRIINFLKFQKNINVLQAKS